ncbi:MAG TPA: transcriptional regulator [Caldisericia bacterium]|jgi:predicted DNA-binding transcriptional regulator YafY|nr:MAG: Bifunctional ligase/repressor BirA [bacterium ADurb.Bin132]HNY61360.1 transcriptional regulator [Caldisericia bacterium]HOC78707.1 transcriptional regulator [Caldisericia bacterium]HOG70225.1 transcriptional regulator [Caldisericia bacterium]HPM44604.1 transcriptional regulator [Caldisericia bacterium]
MLALTRILQLLEMLLQAGGRKLASAEISNKLEISRRQIIRDIDKLRDEGFNIRSDMNGYWLETAPDLGSFGLSKFDKFVITTGLGRIIDSKDPCLSRIAQEIIEKITNENPQTGSKEKPVDEFKVVYLNEIKKIQKIRVAIDSMVVINFKYERPNKPDEKLRKVKPYELFFKRHAYYMIAMPEDSDTLIMYRVNRMKDITLTRERFVRKPIDLNSHLSNAFEIMITGPVEDVEILFKKSVAPFVSELVWHSTQKITKNDDGSIIFKARVAINHEILRWVMGYGNECVVAKPEQLKQMVIDQTKLMLEDYLDQKSPNVINA